jgi:soluble lytic murein transglycosylase-like protein
MFERYGNWADALAAYNWGPGNLDKWIAAGRPAYGFPPDVLRYIERVLRDSLLSD